MATILIVDDLSANRAFLVTLLRYHGHRLLEASDGAEGLTVVRAERPDLVITDVLMPVMDGYELVRQLRLDPATRGIPVVFYTAQYGEREARSLALSNGVAYVLIKPAESAEVLAIVACALSAGSGTMKAPDPPRRLEAFDREHLRLVTNKLSETVDDLRGANARLRALINIGLDLGSERDPDQLLQGVCAAARDLFGATYVTLGIVDREGGTLNRLSNSGVESGDWIRKGDPVSGVLATVVSERRTMRGRAGKSESAILQFPPPHPPVQEFLASPVASPAHVYGWVCLVGNEGRAFSEEDEDLLVALSGQVGRVYENSQFQAVAQTQTEALEREILVREQAEAALRVERDRAQRYLDTAEVILLALDMEGRITMVNRYACSVFGWTAEELEGRDFIETCVPSRIRDETRQKLGRVLSGPDSSVVDNAIITRSGEERLVEWRNTLLRDSEGRVVSTLSSGIDLTERNQAVEALRSADERTRFALEAAGVGIWDMDPATGTVRWSQILEAQYGLKPGTFGGTLDAFVERVHPDDRGSVLETVGEAMKSGAEYSLLNRSIRPGGEVRWLTGAGRFDLGPDGKPVRGVGISMDVTERRALEEQFQQAQKMEAIGRLAGGVAHDFNNLLTAILGYCELMLADLDESDPLHADISEIQKAGERAAGLTRQLLAFSRKQIIEPTVLDLNVVVSDMRAMLERLIGEDVKVVLKLQPEPALVTADRGQLEQILMNLSVNARDAMPKGGTLTIETSQVELDETYAKAHLSARPGHYVMLGVSDTGTGMTAEVQARVFEPFFTIKEPGKGTGLGLATVHGIVLRSEGSIDVCSEVGRGSSFRLYLPTAKATEAALEPEPPIHRSHAGTHTVLLVEDAEGLRDLARRLLQRQGYTVLVAGNAQEALQLFEDNASIDLVLTDVVMPGGSGPDLARKLVERRPALKVIYMSGYTDEAIVQHGVLNPGIAFLPKPFSSESLERKIQETLAR